MNRTTAIIATVVTSVLCGCPGLLSCLAGFAFALGITGTGTVELNGVTQPLDPGTALVWGFGGICGGIVLVAIPVVVGVLTLRNAKTA